MAIATNFTKTFRRSAYPFISPALKSQDQSGRTVLVTGGSEGIGLAIAKRFVEAHAAHVIIASRSQAKLDTAKTTLQKSSNPGQLLSTLSLDFSDCDAIAQYWDALAAKGEVIDVLILNAGETRDDKTLDDVRAHLKFNIEANICMLQRFQNQTSTEKQKTLINITSGGICCYPIGRAAYHASKAAFVSYLNHISDFIEEDTMRVVNMHPGAVYTATLEAGNHPKDVPIWDDVSLPGAMAIWLAGTQADFLHGRVVFANWDAEELLQMKDYIRGDPTQLKIGISGAGTFSMNDLLDVTTRNPV